MLWQNNGEETMNEYDLIQRIIDTLDTDELLDRLDIGIEELAPILHNAIIANINKFEDLGDTYEEE